MIATVSFLAAATELFFSSQHKHVQADYSEGKMFYSMLLHFLSLMMTESCMKTASKTEN